MSKCFQKPQSYPLCCESTPNFVLDEHCLAADACQEAASQFGYSTATTRDGRLLVVGARAFATDGVLNSGAVFVYQRQRETGAGKKQPKYALIQTLSADTPQFNGLFGNVVGVSGDGDRIIVAAINQTDSEIHSGSDNGIVYVYDRERCKGANRYHLAQKVVAQRFANDESGDVEFDSGNSDNFGFTAELSDNGRVLVVGTSPNASPFGKIYIYEDVTCKTLRCGRRRVLTNPFQFRQSIVKTDVLPTNDTRGIGDSLAVSCNGDVIAFGAMQAALNQGRVFVYKRTAPLQWTLEQTLQSTTPVNGEKFGVALAMTPDARRIVVEATGITGSAPRGYAIVFRRNQMGQYEAEGAKLDSSDTDFNVLNAFSVQIDISDNGCVVAIGFEGTQVDGDNNSGDVVIFERQCEDPADATTSNWVFRQRLFEQPEHRGEHRFGFSVALDALAHTLFVGSAAPAPTDRVGKVYTYDVNCVTKLA